MPRPESALQLESIPQQEGASRTGSATNASKLKGPKELTNRSVYPTPIGPVCMSRAEHEAYLAELELRGMLQDGS